MIRYLAGRLTQAILTLVLASLVIFIGVRLAGSPADFLLPIDATPAERNAMIERLGLDEPVIVQYGIYLGELISGEFGRSIRNRQPVADLVWDRFGNSLGLAAAALLITVVVSVPMGVAAAVYHRRSWDRVAMAGALVGQSLPAFWTGIVAILVFSTFLGWLPSSGIGDWRHYLLPAITMGWFTSAGIVRLLRSTMLDSLDSEYIKLARSKGLSEGVVVWKHGVRNALIPVVTFLGFMFSIMLTMSIATEVVFNWPGLGRLAYEAMRTRDYPVLQFTIIVFVGAVIVINFFVDLLYMVLDPRIRT